MDVSASFDSVSYTEAKRQKQWYETKETGARIEIKARELFFALFFS